MLTELEGIYNPTVREKLDKSIAGFPLDIIFLAPPLSPNEKNLRHIEKNGASWYHFKNKSIGIQQ